MTNEEFEMIKRVVADRAAAVRKVFFGESAPISEIKDLANIWEFNSSMSADMPKDVVIVEDEVTPIYYKVHKNNRMIELFFDDYDFFDERDMRMYICDCLDIAIIRSLFDALELKSAVEMYRHFISVAKEIGRISLEIDLEIDMVDLYGEESVQF